MNQENEPNITPLPKVTVGGITFDAVTEPQCMSYIMDCLSVGQGGWVITPNLDHLCRAHRDRSFHDMVGEADVVVADGMPIIWASKLQGTPLPERVAGSTMTISLSEQAAKHNRSIYLLGGEPGAAEQAAEKLKSQFPGTTIAGIFCPEFGFEKDPQQMAHIKRLLVEANPDLVYVALGSPKQEHLVRTLRGELPHAWWLGIGISLSFISGHVKRAPRWMQVCGIEWFHRLIQEPRRLAKRYLVDGIPFALRLLISSLFRRFQK
ncbi:WecB/TagA/CpsF family glycosyltransferase [Poriferisphaera sp. WC338]|uniref:WecB/TagA/CpsF family glycosyltransferase n=1 Tax=Poriferisphaera sp. WC338 TaxID=3425129 RepID=UPI003D815836